jgi:hypothetical protein
MIYFIYILVGLVFKQQDIYLYLNNMLYTVHSQARSSIYANTQLRAHRRAEEKKNKEQKK